MGPGIPGNLKKALQGKKIAYEPIPIARKSPMGWLQTVWPRKIYDPYSSPALKKPTRVPSNRRQSCSCGACAFAFIDDLIERIYADHRSLQLR